MIKAAWVILALGIIARLGGWLYYDLLGTPQALVVSIGMLRVFFLAFTFSSIIWIYLYWKSKMKKAGSVLKYPELTNYIKSQFAQGKKEGEIIQLLETQGGWDIEKINHVFVEIKEEASGSPKTQVVGAGGLKHLGWGFLLACVVFLFPFWTDYQTYKHAKDKFSESQSYYLNGDKARAIETLDEVTSAKVMPFITAQAYLTKGILYREGHFNDGMAVQECKTGLKIDPTIETDGVLKRDKNGNTVADLCRLIIQESDRDSQTAIAPDTGDKNLNQKLVLSKDDYRLCQIDDVVGTWSLTYSYVKPGLITDPNDALNEKYQYYFFNNKGKYRWTVSNLAMDKVALSLSESSPLTSVFSVDNGTITMKQETDMYSRSGLCVIAVRDFVITPGWKVKTNEMIHLFKSKGELIYLVSMEKIEI